MELYIQWMFWIGVAGAIVRLLTIGFGDFPRKEKKTLGNYIFMFILGTAFTTWAGFLLYGGQNVQ